MKAHMGIAHEQACHWRGFYSYKPPGGVEHWRRKLIPTQVSCVPMQQPPPHPQNLQHCWSHRTFSIAEAIAHRRAGWKVSMPTQDGFLFKSAGIGICPPSSMWMKILGGCWVNGAAPSKLPPWRRTGGELWVGLVPSCSTSSSTLPSHSETM